MSSNGFQPDASIFTALWRHQKLNVQNQVTNEVYVNFGLVKWFKTNRAPAGAVTNRIAFWYNPKEQNDDPDLTVSGLAATSLLADLDAIWAGSGSTTGFQPESAIDTAFWRYQYKDTQGMVTSEVYLNFGALKWMKTLRIPTSQVALWFGNKDQDRNADLILDDGPSAKLLSDLDQIWAN